MHRAKEAFKAPCQATSHNKMACMDTKGTESMEPSDEFFFVAAGHHFKINSFIIAANKKKNTDISCPNDHAIDKVHTF